MKTQLRQATPDDAQAISELVQAAFAKHVAPDWEPRAIEHFLVETSADKISAVVAGATYVAICEDQYEVLGVIVLPRPTLVQLFFVKPSHVRRGIGRALWEAARTHLALRHAEIKTVELNSSPYAVSAYEALGFFPISKQFRRAGSVATRMACWLPGRALEHS
jgi:GNAT superfamily N-acetyltransferase